MMPLFISSLDDCVFMPKPGCPSSRMYGTAATGRIRASWKWDLDAGEDWLRPSLDQSVVVNLGRASPFGPLSATKYYQDVSEWSALSGSTLEPDCREPKVCPKWPLQRWTTTPNVTTGVTCQPAESPRAGSHSSAPSPK